MQRIDQSATETRERVFHFGRDLAIDLARHDAVAFELAQVLREDLARDAGDEPLQFAKAPHAALEAPQDQWLPFSADHRQRGFDRTIRLAVPGHFEVTPLQNGA